MCLYFFQMVEIKKNLNREDLNSYNLVVQQIVKKRSSNNIVKKKKKSIVNVVFFHLTPFFLFLQ